MTRPAASSSFGRKGVITTQPSVSRKSAVQRASGSLVGDLISKFAPHDQPQVMASNVTLSVRFTWKMYIAAIAILFLAYEITSIGFEPPSPNVHIIPMTANDPLLFKACAVLAWIIGFAWLGICVKGGSALEISPRGVSAITLYGRQTIAWADVSKISNGLHNEKYGAQLLIHAAWGSPSRGLLHGVIPIYLDRIDTSRETIVAAIQSYRPDLSA
jgi:hypothetical protein